MVGSLTIALTMSGVLFSAQGPTPTRPVDENGLRLIRDGRSVCAVIYPAQDSRWRDMARRIAHSIGRLGAGEVPVVADTDAVPQRLGPIRQDLEDLNLILLGDLNSNRAIFPFYANYDTCCDAFYPGTGGFELRTVVRPLGGSPNCLIVGATDTVGADGAVSRLIAMLDELQPRRDAALPYVLDVKPGRETADLFEPAMDWIRQGPGSRPFEPNAPYSTVQNHFTYAAHLYFYTGYDAFARRAREAILKLVELEPKAVRVSDYTMENVAFAWRRVRPSPVFTPQERAAVDRCLFGTVVEQSTSWWRLTDASKGIGCRHHTTGMLSWWTLIRILLKTGDLDAGARGQLEQWRIEAERYLDGLTRHYADDQDDYQSADSVQNTASYCLQSGKLDWFHNGLAEQAARKLLAITDNRGFYAGIQGYGEALPGWERFMLNGGLLLGACAFVYQDGAYDEALKRLPALSNSWGALQPSGIHQYAGSRPVGSAAPRLTSFLDVLRLTPYRLAMLNAGDFLNSPLMDGYAVTGLSAPRTTGDLAFDKAVIRGLLPESVYLLLQGFSGTSLSTIDMNSIIRYTDLGKLWLVHNTGRRSLYYKNGVHVSNGVDNSAIPAACELLGHADFGDLAMVASRLPDYRGAVWTRYLFVLANRFTLVIDHLRFDKPGSYMASCNWRTPGYASLQDATWEAIQDNVIFSITEANPGDTWSERSPVRDGATRPTVLRQRRAISAEGGEELLFANLIEAVGADRRVRREIRQVAPHAVVVASPRRSATVTADSSPFEDAVLAAVGGQGIETGPVKSDAMMLIVHAGGAWLVGGTFLQIQGEPFAAKSGRVAPAGSWASRTGQVLGELWGGSSGVARHPAPASSPSSPNAPEPAWTTPAPGLRGGLIDGVRLVGERNVSGPSLLATDWILPLLRAEPRLKPGTSGGFDLTPPELHHTSRPSASSMLAETTLAPLKNSCFRLILPESTAIGEISLFGESAGEDAPPLAPAELLVELTFSNDGFDKDARTRTVRARCEPTHHALYKGHDYVFETYRLVGFHERAREVRVRIIGGPVDEMPLSEVQVRTTGAGGVKPVQTRIADVDGDGDDEILVWRPEGELAILRSDGGSMLSKSWPEGIVAVDAWDLEDDGRREIFISRGDRRVDVLNLDGSPRWHYDFSGMRKLTDEKLYGDGSLVYGMVAWKPDGAADKQVLCTSYFFTARLDAHGRLQKCWRRDGHQAGIRQIPARFAAAGQFAIRCDIPWVGPVPLEWWGRYLDKAEARCNVPNGPLVHFDLDDYDADGRVEALLASEEGVGLYGRTEPPVKWQHSTDAPCVGAAAVKPAEGRPATIIYGREDGYIFAVSADGKLLSSRLLDEPLICLTALRASTGQTVILAGTRASLRCLDADDLTDLWHRHGSYRRLELFTVKGAKRVLAITPEGTIESFSF